MPTFNLNFDKKSLNSIISKMKDYQTKMQYDVPYEFVKASCNWIVNRANQYLSTIYISGDLVGEVITSWGVPEIEFKGGNKVIAKVSNTHEKAVYLEFGVGIVGQQDKHPLADINGYEYNINTGKKDLTGKWKFLNPENDPIDIQDGYYYQSRDRRLVFTKGQPAILYLYNAITDYKESGEYLKIWETTLEKILK